jgi:geranylgeranyl diphosphate synthase type II
MPQTQSPSFSQYAAQLRDEIDAALRSYTKRAAGCPARLHEAITYSLLAPGKRLRPMLVLMAAQACGGSIQSAMPAACAVEMVHAYSLVHDDLPAMDDDDLRRGRPTCHKVFGEALAILAGDALLAMALQTLAEGVRPPEVAARCCAALAEAAGPGNMVGGQADDVAADAAQGSDTQADVDRLESLHRRKTGALIRVSLRLGVMVAQADQRLLDALDEYGWRLGLAFQVTDDLLDIRGSEASAGKRVGKDADRGRLTFPALLGVERSLARAEQLVAEAVAALAPLAGRAESLEALARVILERNR